VRSLTVGLVGYYGRGNFGDDLVAAIIGTHLVQQGHRCTVLGWDEAMATSIGLSAARDPVELVASSDAVVLGGGSILSRMRGSRLRRSLRQHYARSIGAVEVVRVECARRGTPLFALSIGGDGATLSELPSWHGTLIQALTAATVRHEEAAALFDAAGRRAICYPDIVLQTARWFPPAQSRPAPGARGGRVTVGIDVYWSNLVAQGALYLPAVLQRLVRRRPDVTFVYLDTTHVDQAPFRAVGPPSGAANAERYQFHDLRQDLDRLATLDLILSTRLHAGAAALSYGVPFVSLFGERKTHFFLRGAGLAPMAIGHAGALRLSGPATASGMLDRWLDPMGPKAAHDAIERSAGHLAALDEMLRDGTSPLS
jgi:polysaccharide pyruvyl transferase WcaK-like protein